MKKIIIMTGLLLAVSSRANDAVAVDKCTPTGDKVRVIYVERCPAAVKKEVVKWKTKIVKEPRICPTCPAQRDFVRTVTESKPYYRSHRVSLLIGAPTSVITNNDLVYNPKKPLFPVVGAMYQYSYSDRISSGISFTSDRFLTGMIGWSWGEARK